MINECIICFNNIDNNKECSSNYIFHQECNCFYNVHSKCLVEWINKYNTCIHCHKPLSFTLKKHSNILENNKHQPFRNKKIKKFKCCIIL